MKKYLRPKHHITPFNNWMNDPNGLIKYKGKYHVFYQHHPYSIHWETMHWGHVVSDDLLNWKHLPIALTPGGEGDLDHCFSGSAIVHDNKLYVIYTGLILNLPDESKNKQQQCLAYSEDGINFHKLGLIIGEDILPKQYSVADFRDPSIYKDGDYFYVLVAAKKKDGRGNILKFKSQDLIKWEFLNEIMMEDSFGSMVECPDYVKDLNLLIRCEQNVLPIGYMHHNLHSTVYEIGKFNEEHKFISISSGTVDYGFDMYAPQVIKEENILIGWMNMWGRNNPSEQYGYSGSMTIPRKLSIVDNMLHQTPVTPTNEINEHIINQTYSFKSKIGFYKFEIEDLSTLHFYMRKGDKHFTHFYLGDNEWVFDRSNSGIELFGEEKDVFGKGIRKMPYIKKDKHEIYVVLDEFSIEIFVDGLSMTALVYPDLDEDIFEVEIISQHTKFIEYK